MTEPKREPGWYWVRKSINKEWEIARLEIFGGGWWKFFNDNWVYAEDSLFEIGPAIPQPGAASERERELREAALELLGLIDDVPLNQNSPCQTDRVFALYEFDRLRTALFSLTPADDHAKGGTDGNP